jgi:hypothetical protein
LPASPAVSGSSALLLAIADQRAGRDRPPHARGAREPQLRCESTHPKPRNFGLGIRRAEERELGQEVAVRPEAVGADLSVGQEGHPGAETPLVEGASVGQAAGWVWSQRRMSGSTLPAATAA